MSNKHTLIANKTYHSDKNCNDLPNEGKTYVKTCKNPVTHSELLWRNDFQLIWNAYIHFGNSLLKRLRHSWAH